ncbi:MULTISPECIES: ParM/StbA family protein [Peribacillus]|uniref:ParM/StbA family protein n=1 Tax=Peribacillus TaxID=2675229 RepID=UPI001912D4DA|nr:MULTISPECIES: ParM/StbA family protein [unclassified Peribacillus]MBK5446693.1 ParM/StbA family protein [Peribacillus sp. TH24]MBK5502966.1 ParM/StbA family protein [Peribacillus sp. TH14]WMX58907.1 ParM/StbA family protein [Peribacillus sp. R9-11]
MARFVSIDIGNDAVKGFLGDLETRLYIPNVIANVQDREIVEMEKNPLNALHVEITSSALKNKNGSFAVGKLASKYPNNDELTPDQDKADSDQPVIMLLTSLAYDAVGQFTEEDGVIEASYYLSTGLPLDETKQGKAKEFRKKLKSSQHEIKFLKTPSLEGKIVRIKFEQVLVNTEGFAAFVDLTTNNDGSTKNEDLIGKTLLINDIGGLSTDSAIISAEAEVDNEYSNGIKKGVSTYLDNIIRKVYTKFKYTIKSRRTLVEIITNEQPEEQYHIWVNGNRVSIKDIIDEELSVLAKEEYKLIKDMWRNVPDIRLAYQIGGGSLVLKPYLSELNQSEKNYPLRFVSEDDSIWMITRAYFKILLMYLQSKGISTQKQALIKE